jgi:hypothetical protein
MKKLMLAGLVVAIGLAPALGVAQTKSDGTRMGPGSAGAPGTNPSTTNPTPPAPSPAPSTPGTPAPPSTGAPSSPQRRLANQADCERAGGKWSSVSMKCEMTR